MVFWIGILVGVLFVWLAVKMGFYETWAMLFNIVIAVYLAIFLSPTILKFVPAAGDTSYGSALMVVAVAVASFLILHVISYIFLTGQYKVPFPKVFDLLGSSILGFLAGFLVWSFASFLISITPISKNTFAKQAGFTGRQTSTSVICWWCDLVNSAVSSRDSEQTTKQAIDKLLKKKQTKPAAPVPAEPNQLDDIETDTTEK